MKRLMSGSTLSLLFAASLIAAVVTACHKDIDYCGSGENVSETFSGPEVLFSAYTRSAATKAIPNDPSYILGQWDTTSSAYLPGAGIGVFAFYQKAKSNGYPNNFNAKTGEPTFMYNQKLERTSTDGTSYKYIYSPRKYWPNNNNDQLSFFAYAPYDAMTAWEDLNMWGNLAGNKVSRHYELMSRAEDQRDLLWSDPVLNRQRPTTSEVIEFDFRHICAKIGINCKINTDDDNAYVTVDKVVVSAKFNESGDYTYMTATGSSAWENLERSSSTKDYILFRASGTNGYRMRTTLSRIGGNGCFMFPFPGTQNVTLTATVTQNVKVNPGTPEEEIRRFSHDFTKTFTDMELKEGKAYDFLLSVSIDPINVNTANIADWSLMGETDYPVQ